MTRAGRNQISQATELRPVRFRLKDNRVLGSGGGGDGDGVIGVFASVCTAVYSNERLIAAKIDTAP